MSGHKAGGREVAGHYTKAEGDEIARLVLQLVRGIRDEVTAELPVALDRNGPNPTYAELERLSRAS